MPEYVSRLVDGVWVTLEVLPDPSPLEELEAGPRKPRTEECGLCGGTGNIPKWEGKPYEEVGECRFCEGTGKIPIP